MSLSESTPPPLHGYRQSTADYLSTHTLTAIYEANPALLAPMTDITSLKSVIAQCHRDLDQLFFVHQEAVLLGELARAIETLQQFTRAQNTHKDFEDIHLLTRLADLDNPGDWPPSLYSHEHRKITTMLAGLEEDLVQLNKQALTGTALRSKLIEMLDREKSIKGLCEHHQEREEAGMLPALDAQTDTEWRTAIIEPFIAEWHTTVTK